VASKKGAHVVVIGRELSQLTGSDLDLLRACHKTAVLALASDGRAFLYELRVRKIPLSSQPEGVSPACLPDAIREACQRRPSRPGER